MGIRVAIAEEKYLGGTCVNVGCVPKKLFVYASHFHQDFNSANGYGWKISNAEFNWQTLLQNKNTEINRLQSIYDRLLADSGADLFNAKAVLTSEHTVQVNGKEISAERILIATGGWPSIPDIEGREFINSSNELFHLDELPKRIFIVGGGYIAVEFACIMHGLGVETHLSYRGEHLLRGFDQDIREFLYDEMRKKGINIWLNNQIEKIQQTTSGYQLTDANGTLHETDLILYATGRQPNSRNLGLEQVGVEMDTVGAIKVNEVYQSSVDSIYALGDVTNRINLTPVATAEAMTLVNHLYQTDNSTMDYSNIPTAVFSQPEIATVGLSEEQAHARFKDIEIYKSSFKAMKHTLSGSDEKTFMKLIVNKADEKVLGVHMVGDHAAEIIQGMAIALKAGATKSVFDATIGIHPTTAEEFVTMRTPSA